MLPWSLDRKSQLSNRDVNCRFNFGHFRLGRKKGKPLKTNWTLKKILPKSGSSTEGRPIKFHYRAMRLGRNPIFRAVGTTNTCFPQNFRLCIRGQRMSGCEIECKISAWPNSKKLACLFFFIIGTTGQAGRPPWPMQMSTSMLVATSPGDVDQMTNLRWMRAITTFLVKERKRFWR